MVLSYKNLMSNKRTRVKARITTDHPASSYGLPVIILPDGDTLDYGSVALLDYQVERATQKELWLLEQWQRMAPPFI